MKRQTKAQKTNDFFTAYKCVKDGAPVKRATAKDGSIPTHPVVPVPDLPESEVQAQCIDWLGRNRVFGNRHNVGKGRMVTGTATSCRVNDYLVYGIIGAGDWIGLMPNGVHLEIEFKKGAGGRLSADQQKRQDNIRRNNGHYYVVHGVDELKFYIEPLLRG